jgi:hypothetical protein
LGNPSRVQKIDIRNLEQATIQVTAQHLQGVKVAASLFGRKLPSTSQRALKV